MNDSNDLVDALIPVVSTFRAIGIPHYVGGSIASSFHGATRSTMDVDIVCELQASQIASFVTSFDSDYYISEPAIREAVARRSSFNLIHLPTSYKVDIFVSRRRPFDVEAMRRASVQVLGDDRTVDIPIATPEDSIISKLEWYRLSNETSERQWDDVSRLLKLLGNEANIQYLESWAESVNVADLLSRLLKQR